MNIQLTEEIHLAEVARKEAESEAEKQYRMTVALEGRIAELEKEAAKLRAEQKKKADMQMEVQAFQRLQKEQQAQQDRIQQAGVHESKNLATQLEDERQVRQRVEIDLNASVRRLRTEVEALRKINDGLQGEQELCVIRLLAGAAWILSLSLRFCL